MNESLNRHSSSEEKRAVGEALFDSLSELLFDKVNLISGTFAVSTATVSTTDFMTQLRVIDTSLRQFMRPDRKVRFRCTFYVAGTIEKADMYILVPAVYSSTVLGIVTDMHVLSSYVGIRVNAGAVSLVSWDGTADTIFSTTTVLAGTTTYYLEIKSNITNAEIYLNGALIGTIPCELNKTLYSYQTFYPLFAPIRSKDGTSVNLNMESYQILQDK